MDIDQDRQTISRLEELFGANRSGGSDQTMPALLAIGREIGAAAGESLIDRYPHLMNYAPVASQHYLEYIVRHERMEAERLLRRGPMGRFRYLDIAGTFGKHNYDRVRDMFDAVDFQSCRRFVLAGCGSLPMTLYHVYDRTDVAELVALDTDAEAIGIVDATVRHFGLGRLSTGRSAGERYDYSQADVIYVANLVRPKRLVLGRIAETARADAVVVLRDPYSLGRLLTERGADHLDSRLEIMKVSLPELSHFSRHVFLRVAARNAT